MSQLIVQDNEFKIKSLEKSPVFGIIVTLNNSFTKLESNRRNQRSGVLFL